MNRLFLLVAFLVLGKISYSQYPLTQNLGSDSTIVVSKGALQSRLIPIVVSDTNAANAQRMKSYPGAQLFTTNGNFYYRNSTATKWILVSSGSAGPVNIYNTDGTLTGNRILTGAGNSLYFDGISGLGINTPYDSLLTVDGGIHATGGLRVEKLTTSPGTKALRIDGQGVVSVADTSVATGTVTSVGSGYGLSGGPITTSGTLLVDSATLSNYYLRRKDSLTATNSLGYVTKKILADTAAAIRASDAGGSVTSVATNNGTGITGGTITTSGTLAIDTTLISTRAWRQKGIDSVANLPRVTSVGLTMPAAFNVAGSPVTSSGTLAVTAAGLSTQYIRGDGQLANFPGGGGGGGSSVVYYFNGGTNQGTFVGNTYYEMSKTAIVGTAANFTINADGYITQFITDAGDPALLNIPAGNWNFEMYFSASSGGGSPSFYVELYKYDGTTFTLISSSSSSPEGITGGTATDLYLTALAVPATSLTLTDRLAVRVYVTHSGRTITLHTQDNTLCQVTTTFTTGITALNGLTDQVQYFATGTSGTDFNISSASATHTFNLPTASATNRGALSTTDWSTFNSKVGGSGTINRISKFTAAGTIGNSSIEDSSVVGVAMTISSFANVGIGTATPSSRLEVSGNATIKTNFASLTLDNTTSVSPVWMKINNGGGNYLIGAANNVGGSIITSTSPYALVINAESSRDVVIGTNNLERVRFDSTGKVGIGTTTIDSMLTVAQGAYFQRGVRMSGLPSAPGTKALRIDANGTLSVADTTTGGGGGIGGSGTTNYLPKFTASTTLGDSRLFDNGTITFLGNGDVNASPSTGIFSGTGGTGTNIAGAELRIRGGASTGNAAGGIISFYTSAAGSAGTGVNAGVERMRLTNTGVGIGTTTTDNIAANTGMNLIVQGSTSGANVGWVQAISFDAATSVALYSGQTTSDNPAIVYQKDLRIGNATGTGVGSFAERVRIANGGNVGIGTSTIGSRLQVNGNAAIGYSASTAAPTNGLAVSGNVVFGGTASVIANYTSLTINGTSGSFTEYQQAAGNTFRVGADLSDGGFLYTQGNTAIRFGTNGSSERMRITNGGNVGIGTTTIGSKLQVNGNAAIGYSASTAAPTNGLIVAGQVGVGVSPAAGFAIDASGTGDQSIRISTTSTGSGANASIRLNATTEGAWLLQTGNAGAGALRFYDSNAGTDRMRIFSNGDVGINTLTAGSKLQVNGNAAIGYSASTAAPTNGLAVAGNIALNSTISGWTSLFNVIEGTTYSGYLGFQTNAADMKIGINHFYDGTGATGYKYKTTNSATQLNISASNGFQVNTAPSGTAGTNIAAFTPVFSVNISGVTFLGNGETAASPSTGIISGTGGTGTNIAGAEFRIRGGASTGSGAGGPITFYTSAAGSAGTGVNAATEIARFDTRGNLGIGVSPSAWNPGIDVIEFNTKGGIAAAPSDVNFIYNIYYDGNNRYRTTDFASTIQLASGQHRFLTAPSGTAGTVATLTERMRITNTGSVGIGTTTIGSTLQVNGNAAIGYSASTAAPTNGLVVAGNTSIGKSTNAGNILEVAGASQIRHQYTGAATDLAIGQFNASGDASINNTANGLLQFHTNGIARQIITSGGQITLATGSNVSAIAQTGYSLTGANAQSLIDLAGTWNTTGNPTAIKLNITNTASGASAYLMDLQVGGTTQFRVTKDGAIRTTAPTGGTADNWKFGTKVASSVVFDDNDYLEVEVGGTLYRVALVNLAEPEPEAVPASSPEDRRINLPAKTSSQRIQELENEIQELRKMVNFLMPISKK